MQSSCLDLRAVEVLNNAYMKDKYKLLYVFDILLKRTYKKDEIVVANAVRDVVVLPGVAHCRYTGGCSKYRLLGVEQP